MATCWLFNKLVPNQKKNFFRLDEFSNKFNRIQIIIKSLFPITMFAREIVYL